MNLQEYQAKTLLEEYGIPVPQGALALSASEAGERAAALGGTAWAVKAQVHAGNRSAAGGVRLVDSPEGVAKATGQILGKRIVTSQTGSEGIEVKKVYIEQAFPLEREIYAAVLVNRAQARVSVIVNPEGGVGVESALAERDKVAEIAIGTDGIDNEEFARLGTHRGLSEDEAAAVAGVLVKARRAFLELDASLIEFNPLAITSAGDVVVLDVKMTIDDNATFRHPELEQLRDEDEVDPQEREAHRFEINYARMDGNIGVVTSGAGFGLATIDMIKEAG
ncbi:MAG TPA: ATP-grasp domain-containing protein, partial [Afifellaceae bacterium]|nr:ATP-grasp domain-containing protein [Afifellaceae bacterium]